MASLVQIPAPEGGSTLKLVGDLDAQARSRLEERLYELAECEDTTIDLASTTSIDLGSVRMLDACRERARLNGRFLAIVNAPPFVTRMLAMLDRSGYWRPQRQTVRRDEGETYTPPPRTTTDAERSRPESEQIVRLECEKCGHQTFRPEQAAARPCDDCGGEMQAVAVFRDRRRIKRSVDKDRRQVD